MSIGVAHAEAAGQTPAEDQVYVQVVVLPADSILAVTSEAAALGSAWMGVVGSGQGGSRDDSVAVLAQDSLVRTARRLLRRVVAGAVPANVQSPHMPLMQVVEAAESLAEKAQVALDTVLTCSRGDSGVRACPLLTQFLVAGTLTWVQSNQANIMGAYIRARARIATALLGEGVAVPACRPCELPMGSADSTRTRRHSL